MPLLIPGPNDPTKDFHVYLRPLIDELKMLWCTGVETYDRVSRSNFTMKATLMWTINDFPALGMISGWSTKGKFACPVCMGMVKENQLKHGGKPTFYGTSRSFLEEDDPLRRSTKFGRCERHSVTTRHSGSRAKILCEKIQFPPPGIIIRQKSRDYGVTHNWTHYSPLFELPYWETLSLRHNIDVMHIDKNVFDNIFYTMLGDKKTKDNSNARNDCKDLGVYRELWIRGDGTTPDAPYVLGREQINNLFHWIKSLNLQYGYVSNISRYLHDLKLKVKNKAWVEGSMAERYIEEEVVHFYELYFESKDETVHNRLRRNEVPTSEFQMLVRRHHPNFNDAQQEGKQKELFTVLAVGEKVLAVGEGEEEGEEVMEEAGEAKGPWEEDDAQEDCSRIANSNQPRKQKKEVLPESQRARTVVACGSAEDTILQHTRAGEARGRAGLISRNPVFTSVLIFWTSNLHGLLYNDILRSFFNNKTYQILSRRRKKTV
ncbi:hypothetical protein AgCh_029075 [Apium graveolens]